MLDEKYMVFKRQEFNNWLEKNGYPQPADGELVLNDAVVIRLQDQFAGGALSAYSDQVMAFIEMSDEWGRGISQRERDRLFEIADYFRSLSDEARAVNKLPD